MVTVYGLLILIQLTTEKYKGSLIYLFIFFFFWLEERKKENVKERESWDFLNLKRRIKGGRDGSMRITVVYTTTSIP